MENRQPAVSYNRETGMVTGSGGKSRMAGEKMQAFQADLDSARAAGDTEKVNQMREKRRNRGAQIKQNRMNRRAARQANGSNGTNRYGDPVGTHYAGGSPTFNEAGGEYKAYTGADGTVTNR